MAFTAHIDEIAEPEWNTLLGQFADASLYQTWAYGGVSWGEKQLSHLVLKRDGQPVALAQLRLVRVPLIGRGVAYLRWGPVCAPCAGAWEEAILRETMRTITEEYVHRRRLLLRIVPSQFSQDTEGTRFLEICQELGLQQDLDAKPYRTFRVDLTPPLDQLRKKLDQKWRNQLNGAERNGLTLVEGTGDELYQQFLALYDDMMARKQFETTVDPREFQRIQQRLPERQKMLVLVTEKDGRPMTGLVGSVLGDMGIYLLGATSDEGMKTKGSYLLQWTFIQRLKERGCRSYDLGGINPEKNPGVYHFKQGLGGEEVTGLGRLSVFGDLLSTASVKSAERLRSLIARVRSVVP